MGARHASQAGVCPPVDPQRARRFDDMVTRATAGIRETSRAADEPITCFTEEEDHGYI